MNSIKLQKKWKEVVKGDYISGETPQVIFQIAGSAEIRFIKVNIHENKNNSSVIIGEVEVFDKTN